MNRKQITETDFESTSWHDCSIWGINCRVGNSAANDWTSDLLLDIDFITDWKCEANRCHFMVAPAELVFHNVTDLRIGLHCDSDFRVSLHLLKVSRIERERIKNQKVCLDRPYYKWQIALNSPEGGEIAFGATGFTQTLLAKPVKTKAQNLWLKHRLTFGSAAARS